MGSNQVSIMTADQISAFLRVSQISISIELSGPWKAFISPPKSQHEVFLTNNSHQTNVILKIYKRNEIRV